MKPTYISNYLLGLLCFSATARAQLYVAAGETLFTKSGETLHADGLTLYPSTDFTLTDNELNRNSSTFNTLPTTYIFRVFRFSNTSPAFTGTMEVNYLDGELNTLPEAGLKTAVHNGTAWQLINTTANSTVSNYVLSSSVSNLPLNEITMAASLSTLPLQWLSFTVQKKANNAVLDWATASELDTKDFVVEHSRDGAVWEPIGTVLATTNVADNRYSFTHRTPETGKHFYRLLQRDYSGKSSYSKVQLLLLGSTSSLFSLYPNPINDGRLNLQLQQAATVSLYNSAGLLILRKDLAAGTNQLELSRIARGVYYLRVGQDMAEIVIQ